MLTYNKIDNYRNGVRKKNTFLGPNWIFGIGLLLPNYFGSTLKLTNLVFSTRVKIENNCAIYKNFVY